MGRCIISTPECSCEPIHDRLEPFGLARDENGKVIKMCFDPKDIPPNIIHESLLAPCQLNTDCLKHPNAYCHGQDLNLDVYDEFLDRLVHRGGFCQTDRPSLDPMPPYLIPFLNSEGTLTKNDANCWSHVDCVGAGEQEKYPNETVNYCNENTTSGKGVCQLFRTLPKPCDTFPIIKPMVFCGSKDSGCSAYTNSCCGVGGVCCRLTTTVIPLKCPIGEIYSTKCRTDSDCGRERSFCWKKNVEDSGGWCCQTKTQSICPDTVTDHRLEPVCNPQNQTTCPRGKCTFGRCCPPVKYNKILGKTTVIPKKSYRTNQPCTTSAFHLKPAVRAFCDPDTRKYVIMGMEMDMTTNYTELPIKDKPCRVNADCHGFNLVCVRTFDEGICYHHPSKPKIDPTYRKTFVVRFLFGTALFSAITVVSIWILFAYSTQRTYSDSFRYLASLKPRKQLEEERKETQEKKWKNEKFVWKFQFSRAV